MTTVKTGPLKRAIKHLPTMQALAMLGLSVIITEAATVASP